jgi:hypothetical protein
LVGSAFTGYLPAATANRRRALVRMTRCVVDWWLLVDVVPAPSGSQEAPAVVNVLLFFFLVLMVRNTSTNIHQRGSFPFQSMELVWWMWPIRTSTKSHHLARHIHHAARHGG